MKKIPGFSYNKLAREARQRLFGMFRKNTQIILSTFQEARLYLPYGLDGYPQDFGGPAIKKERTMIWSKRNSAMS